MKPPAEDAFFIGWAKPPAVLRSFLLIISGIAILGFATLSLAIGAAKPDPGEGGFGPRQTVRGVMMAEPYPTITVFEADSRIPEGRTIMLSGFGKRGVQERAMPLDGSYVEASGAVLARGDLQMIQARGGANGLKPAEGEGAVVDEPLGRWRLSGEVCDGKCVAGAMRPGTGLAHRACANLCLIGGAPPVFVSSGPVEGSEFLMLANSQGGPLGEALYPLVARLITLEGEVVRRGDLLIFRADLDTAELVE